MKKHFRPTLR